MVSLLMNNLSEENEMNLPLKNGYLGRVRYKRRSVSAVRDFPPGCGPNAQRVDGNSHETVETEKVKIEVADDLMDRTRVVDEATGVFPAFQDNPLECELGVLKTNSTQETTQAETGTVKTELETSEMLMGVAGFLETDLQQLETSLPEINSDFVRETNNEDMEMVMEMVRELSEVETPALERQELCDREVNPPVMEKESQETEVAELNCKEPLTTEESQKEKVRSGADNLVGQEYEAVFKIEGKLDVMVPSENSIQFLRKVSATRDFPPFCGRNAPVPTVEDRMRINARKKCLIAIKMHCDETDKGSGLAGPLVTGEWNSKNPGCLSRSKAKKHNFSGKEKSRSGSQMKKFQNTLSSRKAKKPVSAQKKSYEDKYDSVMREDGDPVAQHVEQIDSSVSRVPGEFELSLPPFGPNTSNHDTRSRVRETLRLFQAICRKILQGEEARSKGGEKTKSNDKIRRIDLAAAKIVKEKGKEVNTDRQILGAVPGVEVGDVFQYRVELAIVGIHRLYQAGIDYMKYKGEEIVAASIVASGGYADELDNSHVLIYSGQGGLSGKDKQPEDQKLERGNLALKNSIKFKNFVRVIRGSKETKASESADARAKIVMTYVYDGLYTVERCWQEEGAHGKLVFKFELRRLPGQPELAWKEVKKSNKSSTREGLCVNDLSRGKEIMPICAVNTLDDDKPPPFTYVTRMIYPDSCNLSFPKGCDCQGGCLDAKRCLCAAKNGEIPYNFNGAIVEVKPLVYECGPSCKCPPSCYNRVSQHGIKFQLEIFKTELRGWGVRSLDSITAGSFICEYIGELLEEREAEKRTGNDEYLFDIGQNYSDCSHKPDAEANSNYVSEDGGFNIDASHFGNVGRFINHSCSPNLYAQNVLHDHENKRMPHIMFFAAENIPPLKELTYHYNYTVDQFFDSNGEIKMKMCYCGSSECTGRMY